MNTCKHCGTEYTDGTLFGKEPDLCTPCTVFKLQTQKELLTDIKHALRGDEYWPRIRQIETRLNLLK